MIINKAHWVTDGDNVRFSMPIGKIDQERRIVSGFATLDNVDKQGDIVTTEASMTAFKKFRGNLREMHQPSAVGKVVAFKEDRYFDPNSKKFYSGVYVSAYVSKGAQDAWEKVLDGTYTGFSIGGNIKKFDDSFDDKLDKSIRVIKEYDLHELSLVDNPANQFANVISIEKVNGEQTVGGYLAKAVVENVFWDRDNDIVLLSSNEQEISPATGKIMENIGFVEKNDKDSAEVVKFLVDSAKGIRTIKINKEVNPMTEETNTAVADAPVAEAVAETTEVAASVEAPAEAPAVENVEVAPEAQAEPVAEVAIAKAEESAPAAPVAVEENKGEEVTATVEKSDNDVKQSVVELKESITNAFGDLAATIKSVQDQVAAITKSLETITSEVNSVKGNFNEFGKRVDKVEKDTAFRKSGDLGEIVQELDEISQVQKSLWGGRFLTNADLF